MFSASTKEAASITKDLAANDIRNAANGAKRDTRSNTEGVVNDLSSYANQAGRKVRHFIDSTSDTLTDSTKQVQEQIETNPVRSSVIALGLGFILGTVFRR